MSTTLPQFSPGAELDRAVTSRPNRLDRMRWCCIALAGIGLILVITNIALGLLNQGLQTAVQRRQAFIAQTAPIGRIDNALIVAIASKAAADHDAKLNATLKQAGVTYRINHTAAAKGATQ
jgi:hypothetical protein